MGVTSPDLILPTFADRFNARDLAGFCSLFDEDAVFTYDGVEKAVGPAQIERALVGFIMAGLRFRGDVVSCYVVGDTALTRSRWELLDAGGAVAASGVSVEVQR